MERHFNENGLFYINKKKKVVVYKWAELSDEIWYDPLFKKIIVKCDENDEFDEMIGVALAIERRYSKNKHERQNKYQYMRKLFTNENGLDYEKYCGWVIQDYLGYVSTEELEVFYQYNLIFQDKKKETRRKINNGKSKYGRYF